MCLMIKSMDNISDRPQERNQFITYPKDRENHTNNKMNVVILKGFSNSFWVCLNT